jgi:hypothetical protein
MSNHNNERVLGRAGARELTIPEIQHVTGSLSTRFCTAMSTTGLAPGDGDGCNADHDSHL